MTLKAKFTRHSLYVVFVFAVFIICLPFLIAGFTNSDWHDFDVFYSAAKAALSGKSIYVVVGQYDLPFWYFPWTAWFYIPLTIWPQNIALILYKGVTILCAILIVNRLTHYYNTGFKIQDQVLILSLMIPMSLQVFMVGQMEYILLGLIVITMFAIEHKKDLLAGILFPFLWTKPHLLIIFTIFAFWRAGKRTVIVSIALSFSMLIIETIISPGWYIEMLKLLQAGQQRIDGLIFTTLPNLLGSQENWVGTANLPFTLVLILFAFFVVWKFRSLPTLPLLSLALAASLFCAPRAYAYDLPLLIPIMIWLTANNFKSTFWLWVIAATIPIATRFSSSTYLVTMLIFLLGILMAYKSLQLTNTELHKPSDFLPELKD